MDGLDLKDVRQVLIRDGLLNEAEAGDLKALTPSMVDALKRAATITDNTIEFNGRAPASEVMPDLADAIEKIVATLDSSFCGVKAPAPSHAGLGIRTYGTTRSGWDQAAFTWRIANAADIADMALTTQSIRNEIARAFASWTTASGGLLSFTHTHGPSADITIRFGGKVLEAAFGKPGGVVAVGYFPDTDQRGQLCADNAENWHPVGFLYRIIQHEIGHVLGLSHDNSRNSVMYPFATGGGPPYPPVDRNSREALMSLFGWSPLAASIPHRGTSDQPALATTTLSFIDGSEQLRLHMAWRGGGDNNQLYTSRFIGGQWTDEEKIAHAASYLGPAICEVNVSDGDGQNGLMAAWRGNYNDLKLFWSIRTTQGWRFPTKLSHFGSTNRPALALTPWGGPVMAWKGITGDNRIWLSRFRDGGFHEQTAHRGALTDESPALAFFRGRLYLFWKAANGPDILYSRIGGSSDDIWSAPRRVEFPDVEAEGELRHPVGTTSAPSATVRSDRLVLAWKGISGDARVWFSTFDGSQFSGQSAVTDSATSRGPALCNRHSRLHLLYRSHTNDAIFHRQL